MRSVRAPPRLGGPCEQPGRRVAFESAPRARRRITSWIGDVVEHRPESGRSLRIELHRRVCAQRLALPHDTAIDPTRLPAFGAACFAAFGAACLAALGAALPADPRPEAPPSVPGCVPQSTHRRRHSLPVRSASAIIYFDLQLHPQPPFRLVRRPREKDVPQLPAAPAPAKPPATTRTAAAACVAFDGFSSPASNAAALSWRKSSGPTRSESSTT